MTDPEIAGALEPFQDAALYDWEYRRRRDDVRFYRTLAAERDGPILDLACGTGRLMLGLLRDGHRVVGVDHAPAMLARAAARLRRLPRAARPRALLVRGDLRRLGFRPRFTFAVAAFHSVQHLVTDADLLDFFRGARDALVPGGWLAFDVFAPSRQFLEQARQPDRRRDRTRFRHPVTGEQLVYTLSQRLLPRRRTLLMTFHYQPIDGRGRARGRERHVRLCHRQLTPRQVRALLARAGLTLLETWGGFDGRPLEGDGGSDSDTDTDTDTEQHVYLASRPRGGRARSSR
jgi:SAM-dependent methyltransferase